MKRPHNRRQSRFVIELNKYQTEEVNLLTLTHELAHIICGHLGKKEDEKWPDRRGLNREQREFEAESVGFLVTKRMGLTANSDEYLNGYLKDNDEIPPISIER